MAPQSTTESRAAGMIRDAFDSGRPLIYIRTSEERRIADVLRAIGAGAVWTWSLTGGLRSDGGPPQPGTENARKALDFIVAANGPAIFHLEDFHEPLRASPEIRRRLRDVYESCLDQKKYVVITAPVQFIPD